MIFKKKQRSPDLPKKEELKPIPFDLDTRVTRMEIRVHELYNYLLETDKYTGKKRLTKAGQSVKGWLR